MCDTCTDFYSLLLSFDEKFASKINERPCLTKHQMGVVFLYLQAFNQRQCMCIFRDGKHLEKFFALTQAIIYLGVLQLKELLSGAIEATAPALVEETSSNRDEPDDGAQKRLFNEKWTLQDRERLFLLLSKLFLMNFPLYQAYKASGLSKSEDMSQIDHSVFCNINDVDMPIYLIRNVALFCRMSGIQLISACFDNQTPLTLPVSMAHAIISIVCNLKLWLNLRSTTALFVPLRSKVLRYMCVLNDKDLRLSGIKHMAEYMWNAVKEPFETVPTFDREGLELAFKYFTSSTLTMRLAGIAQINSYISVFNELCNNENMVEAESIGQSLADWLISVNIISHIFGPNLHVEVIKQSHIILNFLAMECKISNEHMDIIWQAAQLKHCSKQVHDVLPAFINNLEGGPVLHLYGLLCKLEPKDHTEQSLFLASALIKFMWTSGGGYHLTDELAFLNMNKVALSNIKLLHHEMTSSDNSISNSEMDSSQHSEPPKSASEASDGPTPCKRARKHRHSFRSPHHQPPSSDESIKIDDVEDMEEEEIDDEDEEDEEEEEEESEDSEHDVMDEQHAALHHRKMMKRGVLSPHFLLHGNEPSIQETKPLSPASDMPVKSEEKEQPIIPEAESPVSDTLTPVQPQPVSEVNKSLEDLPPAEDLKHVSDHDADEEKSGGEETQAKVKRKKVLRKRKGSASGPSDQEKVGETTKDCCNDDDETESENETKKKKRGKKVAVKSVDRDLEDMSVDEEGSYSSRMSTKSDKNMPDFDGDDSACEEEELVRLAAHQVELGNLGFHHPRFHGVSGKMPCRGMQCRSMPCRAAFTRLPPHFSPDNVCKPGNTLLWDLLQDDNIDKLGENLACEAEKILSNLLCFNTEKPIRMKFIEGCLENLSRNRSVVVSLRLLPKLFASFQDFRGGGGRMNTHTITTWAEKNLQMMRHFFNNLQVYSLEGPKFYSHQVEVNVRLQFLSYVFSPLGSPETFQLSLTQVDTLWSCLAIDVLCSDELFSWLLNNARSKEHLHALGMDALRYLYLKKLPSLRPETMSMVGLTLFQQLHSIARYNACSQDAREIDRVGMEYLWKVALRANNTDMSMSAVQYINQYYMSRQLGNESEFISECMSYLSSASKELLASEEASLLCIQRALLLLKTHLETFKRRYAYHLRRWTLEGKSVGSHVPLLSGDRGCVSLRIIIQPANNAEKTTIEMLSSDYVADLRAEVAKWWEGLQLKRNMEETPETPVLGALLTDGPLRLITNGQELSTDCDEKTLQEMMFKDQQVLFISMGASRQQKRRDILDSPSVLPPPPRENLPTLLLLQSPYFEQLFQLMQSLSAMKTTIKGGQSIPHTKAQVLSRRVWDILTLLPTNPKLLEGFEKLDSSHTSLQELLDPSSPQKLMYSLYIIESLLRPSSAKGAAKNDSDSSKSESNDRTWGEIFIRQGGLRYLFDIFMSGTLQRGDGSEWQQDCLASLLKLLCHLGMLGGGVTRDIEADPGAAGATGARFRPRRKKANNFDKPVPMLSQDMLLMLTVDGAMERLTGILYEASLPRDPNHYKTGFWGRAQVVHYAMALLVSWVHSTDGVYDMLLASSNFSTWLQRLVLEDPEPAVRRELCTALYRLCLGVVAEPPPQLFAAHMLAKMLDFLSIAESMGPQKLESLHNAVEDGKEPYGPACRDYFWLLCRLVDSLSEDFIKESIEDPSACIIDIDRLARRLAESMVRRDYLESRHNTVEDNALIGLLNLMTHVIKHKPPFKGSKDGQLFVSQLFEFLFELPNPRMRYLPKCKSQLSRSSTYDLISEMVRGSPGNHLVLHQLLMRQHQQGPHYPYPWDYWPHEDGRSDCGYVGLTNLGATCYMASCMQHLYMMPQARTSILHAKCTTTSKHEETLKELQRMFAYLMESERKAYNPRSFCKVYTMDHQPLNTGEQKDMAEFFIDLVSKLEEMTPETKKLVKTLFGGVISNNVVSLDCDHVSRTLEEFYTVRCQVTDMRNLYESLDEVTVKDTLEGDNMYTCSQCGKKVRAEKRACFKKLPHILCFNTMRYTFNMLTMLKEKVNTLFSFPLRLDMSGYVEKHLMPQTYQEEKLKSQLRDSEGSSKSEEETASEDFNEKYEYELIGVTVHTGTADGGHYYSFIRDRTTAHRDKWFIFNDAEVKPFDPNQLAAECFGGEMTSKTYDSVSDKFLDFSFEKTNSAYMLFYERCSPFGEQKTSTEEGAESKDAESSHREGADTASASAGSELVESKTNIMLPQFELCKDLEDWIWQDNMHFLRDKNIFEHTYFNFMWQICSQIPQTLVSQSSEVTELAAQLSTSFFLETYIHAKEKPMMVQWMEILTKQFVASRAACEWFLGHMAENDCWPVQILIKCPNQMVRQMFQRLCIHVIQQLRHAHVSLYLKTHSDDEDSTHESYPDKVGSQSCVTMFVRKLLSLLENNTTKAHLKHLTEYFMFLYEFSKMGEAEARFLISIQAISTMVNFYLGHKATDFVEVVSEEDEEEDIVPLPTDKYKPASLEKMIALIASLAEKSRGPDKRLELTALDITAVTGSKFIYQQTREAINLNQTRNLVFTLCQYNDPLAQMIVAMIFQTIARHAEFQQPFLKLLSLLTDPSTGASSYTNMEGMPCFSQYVLQGVWDVAEVNPSPLLDWLANQVTRNPHAHSWVLQSLEIWVEPYLMASSHQRVRAAAAYLLVALVPNAHFRQWYRSARGLLHHRELLMAPEALAVLHTIYTFLLRKLKAAHKYSDVQEHGPSKLTPYFTLLHYCCPTRAEKLMFSPYFQDLWNLFLPNLSEPSISVHYNKQSLLSFWHHVCTDCPENINLILGNSVAAKNIAFNYILADHEDQEVVLFNRVMLPVYYGLLRMCCQQSRPFTRQLASHQNINWAFKNITPYSSQYPAAVEELFKLMQLFATKLPDMTEQEITEVETFRKATMHLYLQLDGRLSWATLISAFRILVESEEEKLWVVYNNGIQMLFEAFQALHAVYHEGSTCPVVSELLELLSMLLTVVRTLSHQPAPGREPRNILLNCKDWMDIVRKLTTLQNSYNPPEMRILAIDLLREILVVVPREVIQILTPLLSHCHSAFQESSTTALPMGPYFPRKGIKTPTFGMKTQRPGRPLVQMAVPNRQIEPKGLNADYDAELVGYFAPYHRFIDCMCRAAVKYNCLSDSLIHLSAVVGFEGAPLHLSFFPAFWLEMYNTADVDKKFFSFLLSDNFFVEYVETILLDERTSLNVPVIYQFLSVFFSKVASKVLSDSTCQLIENLVITLNQKAQQMDVKTQAAPLNSDLRALHLVYSNVDVPIAPPDALAPTLDLLLTAVDNACKPAEETTDASQPTQETESPVVDTSTPTSTSSSSTAVEPSPTDWLAELKSTITQLLAIINKPTQ